MFVCPFADRLELTAHCRDFGMAPESYDTDNGSTYTSKRYTGFSTQREQLTSTCGAQMQLQPCYNMIFHLPMNTLRFHDLLSSANDRVGYMSLKFECYNGLWDRSSSWNCLQRAVDWDKTHDNAILSERSHDGVSVFRRGASHKANHNT